MIGKNIFITNDHNFYPISSLNWHFTFGTFAIGMNKRSIKLLSDSLVKISDLTNPIDVHIFWILNKHRLIGRVLYPFLIMPDVTESDNMDVREQQDFCLSRRYQFELYHYISLGHLKIIRKFLDENCISLRQIFFDDFQINHIISKSKILSKINHPELTLILDFMGDNINLIQLFNLIEGSNSKFVFVVPSFNNEHIYSLNLDSVRLQSYPKYLYRTIYVDDGSTDKTNEFVKLYMEEHSIQNHFQLRTQRHYGQCLARYQCYHLAFDDEILVMLDGDDWLSNENVLTKINDHYLRNNLLCSYGSYYVYDKSVYVNVFPFDTTGFILNGTRQFPSDIIKKKSYRSYDWISCHLRSGYAKLFKNIKIEDLFHINGEPFKVSTDLAEMLPVLEQADKNHMNIMDGLCVYNKSNSNVSHFLLQKYRI